MKLLLEEKNSELNLKRIQNIIGFWKPLRVKLKFQATLKILV